MHVVSPAPTQPRGLGGTVNAGEVKGGGTIGKILGLALWAQSLPSGVLGSVLKAPGSLGAALICHSTLSYQ